jgi:hypothetical protein
MFRTTINVTGHLATATALTGRVAGRGVRVGKAI